VLEPNQDGIWIINAEANTAYANERMAEILGVSAQEMKGQPSFTYVFPEDVQAAQRLFDLKKRGDTSPFHFRLRRKDGSEVWVNVQGTPLHNAAGEFKGIVGTFTVSGSQRLSATHK
jgi:PAS domain S-box-containing protein